MPNHEVAPAITLHELEKRIDQAFGKQVESSIDYSAKYLTLNSYAGNTRAFISVCGSSQPGNDAGRLRWCFFVKEVGRSSVLPDAGWDREVRAYDASIPPRDGSAGLRAPIYYGTGHVNENISRIWLEYVHGRTGEDWELEEWSELTRALASWQKSYIDQIPHYPHWMNAGDLRRWIETDRESLFSQYFNAETFHATRTFIDADVVEGAARLWDKRQSFLTRLDGLPHTICHNDIWANNVMMPVRGERQPVVLDWHLLGPAPAGGDLPFAVLAGVWLMLLPVSKLDDFETALIRGYLSGAGHYASDALTGFRLTAALRYVAMLPQLMSDIVEPKRRRNIEERYPTLGFDEIIQRRLSLVRSGLKWARASTGAM